MGAEPALNWQDAAASALEWWRDAGVDMLVEDAPRDWLARPAARPELAAATPAAAPPAPVTLPDTIEAFVAWRLGDAAPEAEWMSPRIPPSGPVDAGWVVLTDMPDPEDRDALMTGAPGRLLDRMLLAVGLSRATVHLASLAVARPVTGQIPPEQQARLGELVRHQLRLLAPRKLLLLGQAASRAVLGTDGALPSGSTAVLNQFGPDCAIGAIRHPRFLLEHPAHKGEAWKRLLQLHRGTSE